MADAAGQGQRRDGISAGVSGPWIGHKHVRQSYAVAKGRVLRHEIVEEHVVAVSEHAEGRADRHLPVSRGVPHHSDSGKELVPLRTIDTLPARILLFPGKRDPRWSVLE